MTRSKIWSISTAAIAATALLAGCTMGAPGSAGTGAKPSSESTEAAQVPASGELKVGIAAREILNDYNRDIVAGAQGVFEAAGGSVTTTNGGGDSTKQINDIDTLINSGINVLFIELGDPQQLAPVVKKAVDKGITVVTAGVGSLVNGAVADVGGDETLMSQMAARALFESINYEGDVYAFWVPGAPLLETRLRILQAMAEDYPKLTIHTEPTDFSPATTQSSMQALLTANPEPGSIDGVWGAYDQMTSGAVQAIQSANRSEIKAVSIDGDRATFSMLFHENSPFVATVVQDAQLIGELGAQAALDARDGKDVGVTVTSAWVATRNNGIAAAEERYGSSIWDELKLDPTQIEQTWQQDQDVVIMRPITPTK
jgi:ribose transport system substrate-binding protein